MIYAKRVAYLAGYSCASFLAYAGMILIVPTLFVVVGLVSCYHYIQTGKWL